MSDLDKAYNLNGPDDCARLYAEWAATYDSGFASNMGYRLPAHVAAAFLTHGGTGPVLDVGAGTGLLAAALVDQGFKGHIDGIDLSPEMLEHAATKGVYTTLAAADVTRPLPLPRQYRGIVSSGTFTHGHVGPEALSNLEAVALPNAVFAVSINAGVFDQGGFAAALSRRNNVRLMDVAIYSGGKDSDAHAQDRALIAIWQHASA